MRAKPELVHRAGTGSRSRIGAIRRGADATLGAWVQEVASTAAKGAGFSHIGEVASAGQVGSRVTSLQAGDLVLPSADCCPVACLHSAKPPALTTALPGLLPNPPLNVLASKGNPRACTDELDVGVLGIWKALYSALGDCIMPDISPSA
mmetsp:Transcript_48197/g.86726  ORF Transcript_48197/g.86726 Transcript_48197/m.86726 type:complete len:149 (-) Transcript_48197:293-739(-)